MRVVVKLGGEVLAEPALGRVAEGVVQALGAGSRLWLVHGGGPQVTARCRAAGIEPRIVGGRRITDAATLAVMEAVMGELSRSVAEALRTRGVRASILPGVVRARKRPPRVVSGAGTEPVDFGLVGDVTGFALSEMAAASDAGDVPVIPCLGRGEQGETLNINADIVASQLAAALGADALVAVAGVGGVRRDKDDATTRLPRLTVTEAKAAITDGTVQGGMIPKLEEAFAPLAAGVSAVHIVAPDEIAQTLASPGSVGTLLVP